MQERLSKNGTTDDFWSSYYRYKYDHNTTSQDEKKSQPLDLRFKSKRKKPQQTEKNSVTPNESLYISTSTMMTTITPTTTTTSRSPPPITTTTTPFISFVTEKSTAVPTKTTSVLQFNDRNESKTSEINSKSHITDRITFNDYTTNKMNEILTTTTEHSIAYNVTANNQRGVRINRPKGRKLSNAIWGRWQKWTKCSRSCGGGVMSQSRHCLSRYIFLSILFSSIFFFGFKTNVTTCEVINFN